jgi:hypothetical protein
MARVSSSGRERKCRTAALSRVSGVLAPPAPAAILARAMTPFLAVLIMFLGPIAAGLLLAGLQLAVYRLVLRRPPETVPPFPILLARGVFAAFALAALGALLSRAAG